MDPAEFVEALYRNCLGRAADPSALANCLELLRSTGDPTQVLKLILDSPEYRARGHRSKDGARAEPTSGGTEPFGFVRTEVNPRLRAAPPLRPMPDWERVEMTASCRDTDHIHKVRGAGGVFAGPGGVSYQRMHNGLRVLAGGYHGEWMTEIIRRLGGHHEPQEEAIFHAVLPHAASAGDTPVMIELGAFWGYYSLWFRSVYPDARNILVEPDPNSLRIGQRNFELNGFAAEFVQAGAGAQAGWAEFRCESDGEVRSVKLVTLDSLVSELGLGHIHLLHADIQGAELGMLDGAAETIAGGRLNWLFLSTHHYSISGDPLTHQRCLKWLEDHGANIVEEHAVSESFSGDGLIVAAFGTQRPFAYPPISRNIPSRSLFRETEYDLAEAWGEIRRLRNQS